MLTRTYTQHTHGLAIILLNSEQQLWEPTTQIDIKARQSSYIGFRYFSVVAAFTTADSIVPCALQIASTYIYTKVFF